MRITKLLLSSLVMIHLAGCSKQEDPFMDFEKQIQTYNFSYTVKPIPKDYSLDAAVGEKIYEIHGDDIYFYLVKDDEVESALLTISNDLFPDKTVAVVKNYIFVHSEEMGNDEQQLALYEIIEEIRTK